MKGFCLEVWGDYACFTRPEMKVERVSYDVITPSAARAIFEAILWKPAIRWQVDKIEILKPIKWTNVRRNEVGKVASPRNKESIFIEDERQQRAALILKDVAYRLHAHFEMTDKKGSEDTEAKFAAMFERRAENGQCFHRPYFGTREFAVDFKLVQPDQSQPKAISEDRDLGWMVYDIRHDNSKDESHVHSCTDKCSPRIYRPVMKQGIILVPDWKSEEVRG
ncbi:MAG: type I-C CRISPR-associated protein Cas5 [Candidatus Raymondbacteria bacterium RifOxyC12_full_50_8]|uniref:pre-crRNA processing endonuclease n=1 Tax=Candidatus Raymondbacteria bacterium RIFOXYD12_FULL_49_13 TaxID=1817890 RepID=A0A1F7F9P2_UNCRA|nr:MAG: type I-C CRISPR-associated protein Cas5 [Candidatus Raymondbacteria bacterium RifOxyB12_full_50_8]OGJ93225.1 MAG: type I-C CRISPR-associated protein Cas5 [Candidatus Raymondbacteria bacterium RIFOXYA2_FULL_49_16]OGK03308.1 MAG: type I-C CRISPR-associated protein Cas5 [Candidatus Raymondbacteria bacterium RIFOXYD12_FULL_49_13]OGK07419.1 MAG: type I-C CRISPR-associated protein Cas5 [Candidatus Raymondbacteria bacterium RifOxyC12_full_50_8]OGP44947.1 MAG: type I-C CRISPR-associated protein